MPLDYALLEMGAPNQGNMLPAPILPVIGAGEVKLAEGTQSADIVVSEPCLLMCNSDVALRLDVRPKANAGALNAPASGAVIQPGMPRFFTLRKGTWVLKTAVY